MGMMSKKIMMTMRDEIVMFIIMVMGGVRMVMMSKRTMMVMSEEMVMSMSTRMIMIQEGNHTTPR